MVRPERLREYKKEQYWKHRDKDLARSRANYLRRREERLVAVKEYYQRNRERVLAQKRKHRAKHAAAIDAKVLEYRRKHPEKHAEWEARRRARKRSTQVAPINFGAVLRRSNGLCGICGKPFDLFGIHFDHIVPLARGGTHTEDNIQAAHARCNARKSAKVA